MSNAAKRCGQLAFVDGELARGHSAHANCLSQCGANLRVGYEMRVVVGGLLDGGAHLARGRSLMVRTIRIGGRRTAYSSASSTMPRTLAASASGLSKAANRNPVLSDTWLQMLSAAARCTLS